MTSLSPLPARGNVCLKIASRFSEEKRPAVVLMAPKPPAKYQTFLTVTLAERRHVWETLATQSSCRTHVFRAQSILRNSPGLIPGAGGRSGALSPIFQLS